MNKPITGRVIKLLAGFYFVQLPDTVIRCRARGRLKNLEPAEAPVVGDMVEVEIIGEGEGVVNAVLPRTNLLQRPTVSNITQMVVVASFSSPDPNQLLLDRLLVAAEHLELRAVLCFNKLDLVQSLGALPDMYRNVGYTVLTVSLQQEGDLKPFFAELRGHVSVLAGQSGVGKSSVINWIKPGLELSVGTVSDKSQLGKHTTRHVELIHISDWDAYVVDTPGFSKLELPENLHSRDLSDYFPEMRPLRSGCRFGFDCRHHNEPGCAVLAALGRGDVARMRYDNYLLLFEELVSREKNQYK